MIRIDLETNPRLYSSTFPSGATVLGVVIRANGETGALVRLESGIFSQINAGVIRALPQREVELALVEARALKGLAHNEGERLYPQKGK